MVLLSEMGTAGLSWGNDEIDFEQVKYEVVLETSKQIWPVDI